MAEVSHEDHVGLFDPAQFATDIHAIGLGGASAYLRPLVNLGIHRMTLHLYDPDPEIDGRNVPAHGYFRPGDIGRPKIEAAEEILSELAHPRLKIVTHAELVTPDTPLWGVVIAGVDSMDARRDIWQAVEFNPDVTLYVDGRIGGETVRALVVNHPSDPDEVEFYRTQWLDGVNDGENVAPLPCGNRTNPHAPLGLASLITGQFIRYATGKPTRRQLTLHVGTGDSLSF